MEDFWFDDFDDYEGLEVLKHISNSENSVDIIRKENDDVVTDEGYIIGSMNDTDIDDKIEEFAESWREVHWNRSDWADWYGCDEDDLDDAMDNDMRDYD